ncbi:unnamed protein product [Chrysoparadoxa australica]
MKGLLSLALFPFLNLCVSGFTIVPTPTLLSTDLLLSSDGRDGDTSGAYGDYSRKKAAKSHPGRGVKRAAWVPPEARETSLTDYPAYRTVFTEPVAPPPSMAAQRMDRVRAEVNARMEEEQIRRIEEFCAARSEQKKQTQQRAETAPAAQPLPSSTLLSLLGLSASSTFEEVKSGYKSALKKCHPDATQDESAVAQFHALTTAWAKFQSGEEAVSAVTLTCFSCLFSFDVNECSCLPSQVPAPVPDDQFTRYWNGGVDSI